MFVEKPFKAMPGMTHIKIDFNKKCFFQYLQVVTLSSRVVSQRAGNRHLLVVHRVRSDDTGVYMCYATNDMGSSQKTIAFDDMVKILSNQFSFKK